MTQAKLNGLQMYVRSNEDWVQVCKLHPFLTRECESNERVEHLVDKFHSLGRSMGCKH